MDAQQVRAVLEERVAILTRRVASIGKHLRAEDGRLSADFSDRVAFTEGDEVLEALDDVGRAELGALQGALRRLEDGSYGDCVACGEGIAPARLQAVPVALRCVSCEAAAES